MMKRSSWEAGEAGLASSSHRWPTQSKLAKMSLAMSPYTSYGSIRVTMKLEVHILMSDSYELYASVSRTTSVVFTRVFDAHHHRMYDGYEYSA